MSRPASEAPVASAPANLGLLATTLILSGCLAYGYITCGATSPAAPVAGAAASASSWASNGISESSSGTLFRAVRTRSYPGETLFASWTPASSQPAAPELRVKSESTCRNWAVTTTIFPPTTTIKQIASLSDWCLVIAGDKKAPKDYQVSGRAIYLSPADQERMPFATGKLLRWNHFGRKNLGFLYALQHGARWVYDTDDDNELQSLSAGIPLPRPNALIDEVETQFKLYNLYPQMSTAPSSWPRGFPLESIKDRRTWNSSFTRRRWPARRVGVVQSLADHDPDVDGIYRLTQPLPFATLHAYDALWGLLLPCTVHGRVTDIWRAYFTQRLLWDAGYRIAFSTPWVTQYRNAHNYLADFNSEIPLYQQAGALVQALLDWKPKAATMPGRIEELYILMYEMNVLGLDDVKLAQAWLGDLMRVGYRFPPIRGGEESP